MLGHRAHVSQTAFGLVFFRVFILTFVIMQVMTAIYHSRSCGEEAGIRVKQRKLGEPGVVLGRINSSAMYIRGVGCARTCELSLYVSLLLQDGRKGRLRLCNVLPQPPVYVSRGCASHVTTAYRGSRLLRLLGGHLHSWVRRGFTVMCSTEEEYSERKSKRSGG